MSMWPHQKEILNSLLVADTDDFVQLDTGAGKTMILCQFSKMTTGIVVIVAHRTRLITQISATLGGMDIPHMIIGTEHTRRNCQTATRKARIMVGSVQSIIARQRRGALTVPSKKRCTIVIDEAHHALAENMWGKCCTIFSAQRVVGFSATPWRLDAEPLKKPEGLFDRLVQATALKTNSVSKLIKGNYLSGFVCYSTKSRLDSGKIKLGAHDYIYSSLNAETRTHMYEMAGDAVANYKQYARGKRAFAFCVSIEIAEATAKKFRDEGVSSTTICSEFSAVENERRFNLFASGNVDVICHVDMLGEGVDVPGLECIIMLRKTASLGLCRQWYGRVLRYVEEKKAIIIDHVGNCHEHGLPDTSYVWDLESKRQPGPPLLINCKKCHALNDIRNIHCTECGAQIEVAECKQATENKYIDWDLIEIARSNNRRIYEHENVLKIKTKQMPTSSPCKQIMELRLFCADALLASISIAEINEFMSLTPDSWWLKNFKYSDIGNIDNALEKYREWLTFQ